MKQISADELVVVANAAETPDLGKSDDLFGAARQMLAETEPSRSSPSEVLAVRW